MPLVMLDKFFSGGYIEIPTLLKYYPRDVEGKANIFFVITRVFNDKLEEIVIKFDNPFEREIRFYGRDAGGEHYIVNLGDIIESYHIPQGYYIELLIRYISNVKKIKTVFPGEIRYAIPDKIPPMPKERVEEILLEFEPHEIITKLAHLGFSEIPNDLKQGGARFNSGDYEGSIKFFRKVVEGFRQMPINEFIGESNRAEKIKAFLNSSFNLLSNFGEHTGTSASEEEAELAKDLAFGISKYFIGKQG